MKQIFILLCCSALLGLSAGQGADCPSEGISYLPLPDCTLYIICVNGQAVEEECPRPLYFSSQLERCDFPENVPECVGGTRPPVGGNSTTTTLEPTEEPSIPTSTIPSTNGTTLEPTEEPTVSPNITTTGRTTTTPTPPPPGTLTQCGETIEADFGKIEYKPNQTYEAGELCAFIIRVPSYPEIIFQLESHGINNISDPDAITIISYDSNALVGFNTAHLGPPNPYMDAYVTGNVAVVIFKTNSNSRLGTGFVLHFLGMGTIVDNLAGRDFVFNNQSASPLELPFQTNWTTELSKNFIVLTDSAKLITEPGSYLNLTVSEEFDEDYVCSDYFWIYSFQGDSLSSEGLFCDEDRDRTVYETTGLFIIAFRKWPETPLARGTLRWEKVVVEQKN